MISYCKQYLIWWWFNLTISYARVRYRAKFGFTLLMGNEFPPVVIMNTIIREEDAPKIKNHKGVCVMYAKRKMNLVRYLDYQYPGWRNTTLRIALRRLINGLEYQDKEMKNAIKN